MKPSIRLSMIMLLYSTGYSVGPYIGGAIVTANWRWVFGIKLVSQSMMHCRKTEYSIIHPFPSLPATTIAVVLAFFVLRKYIQRAPAETNDVYSSSQSRSMRAFYKLRCVDWLGTALFTAGGILILLALNWGSNEVWDLIKVVLGFAVGAVLLIIGVVWQYILESKTDSRERRSSQRKWPNPLIPLTVFRFYDVCATQYVSYICGMVTLVVFYFVTIFTVPFTV
jgi:hypothetical protein